MATRSRKIETLKHDAASRKNIPTAEFEPVLDRDDQEPIRIAFERRNRDLDPQFVWRGKDVPGPAELLVQAPPLFIQEKVHPKVLVDDLERQTRQRKAGDENGNGQPDLFADFNGLPGDDARTEFYRHDANWSNRMILGDSLQVMASLAEREGLRGKVQCIYLDPPYGIKFNSNFQWSTTSRDVKDGKAEHISREPEQVKAFRDTWRDGIHSYLTYLRDRLTVARELLAESGSIFVQIGDENVHRVRALMDEVFGESNAVAAVTCRKTTGNTGQYLPAGSDALLWYAKDAARTKYRDLFAKKVIGGDGGTGYTKVQLPSGERRGLTAEELRESYLPDHWQVFTASNLTSQSIGREKGEGAASWFPVKYQGQTYRPSLQLRWKTNQGGMDRLLKADRVCATSGGLLGYVRYFHDFPVQQLTNIWMDTIGQNQLGGEKVYVVQTALKIVQRCLLMTTDPGDLVLDPTCGSGTTAYVAEQWGRRWITIDTSRVALALARARVMGARYPYYLLADSAEGQRKEAEIARTAPSETPTRGDVRQGFVYERVPHVTLKSIANNAEIDVIWERWQKTLEPLRSDLNAALGRSWEEWEIPRDAGEPWPTAAAAAWKRFAAAETDRDRTAALQAVNTELDRRYTPANPPDGPRDPWPTEVTDTHRRWWEARIARQREIDASIAVRADVECLYDKPYEDKKKVRVAGPFTVESLSPHRLLALNEHDKLIDRAAERAPAYGTAEDFTGMVLSHLATAGVQQAHKADRIQFTSLEPWPGKLICAQGRYLEVEANDGAGGTERRAGVLVGPEFGTVARQDLVRAAREAGDAGFDILIACAFNYEPHATEFNQLGALPVLKARMNADLHMGDDLANTGKGNLFVVFGEPDIEILPAAEEAEEGDDPESGRIQVRINGVDVFHPNTGEVRSDGPDGIACWFIDTDYNDESFFVRHAYFLGANDPYKALRTTLKAEIDREAWATLHSNVSRAFDRPASGRIAVKVINHLGDEVMKVFEV